MNSKLHSAEMFALLMVAVTTQQLTISDQHIFRAGDASWLSSLLIALCGLLVCFVVMKLAGKASYFDACAAIPGARVVCGVILTLLFLELAAQTYKSLMDMLGLYALSFTPRLFLAFVVLLAILPGCFVGTAAVGRALRLELPLMSALLFLIMLFSVIEQGDVNHLFPLFGNGPVVILNNVARGFSSFLWLLLPLIELPQLRKPRAIGVKAVLGALLLTVPAYLAIALITPQNAPMETSFPIQQLSAVSGYSGFLQRLRSVFLFVWVPAFAGTVAVGLCYAAKSLSAALNMEEPKPLLLPLATLLLCLSAPLDSLMPDWYAFVMANKPLLHAGLFLLLLLPYIVLRIRGGKKGGAQSA
ncbi:MAG: spore germination protein [Christensenellaceae bacterium]|jgi:hypothetical protein|nr:spore germination protein [Christensenellaceae bacterium]